MPQKYEVSSAHPVDLADGRVVAGGETVTLKDDEIKEAHNEGLIGSGVLVEQSTGRKNGQKGGGS